MRWVEGIPDAAIPCARGHLDVEALNEAVAVQLAKVGASAYVTERIAGAVATAVRASAELAEKLAPLPAPEVVYTLGAPIALSTTSWRIPFEAFALPRKSAK